MTGTAWGLSFVHFNHIHRFIIIRIQLRMRRLQSKWVHYDFCYRIFNSELINAFIAPCSVNCNRLGPCVSIQNLTPSKGYAHLNFLKIVSRPKSLAPNHNRAIVLHPLLNMAKWVRIFWPDPTWPEKYSTRTRFFWPVTRSVFFAGQPNPNPNHFFKTFFFG